MVDKKSGRKKSAAREDEEHSKNALKIERASHAVSGDDGDDELLEDYTALRVKGAKFGDIPLLIDLSDMIHPSSKNEITDLVFALAIAVEYSGSRKTSADLSNGLTLPIKTVKTAVKDLADFLQKKAPASVQTLEGGLVGDTVSDGDIDLAGKVVDGYIRLNEAQATDIALQTKKIVEDKIKTLKEAEKKHRS